MLKLISKLIGGNKSEKDVKQLEPIVVKINQYFEQYQSFSNDDIRAKTIEFKQRIKDHLKDIDAEIESKKQSAETLADTDIQGRDAIYREKRSR
jgi:preprotein translocase subunit SecA